MPADLNNLIFLSTVVPIAITLIVLLLVGFFLFRLFSSSIQRREVLAHGVSAPATIMRVWETGVRINEQPQIGLALQVQPPSSAPFEVQTTMLISFLQASQFQPGQLVNVKYDPNNPRKVAIESTTGATAASLGAPNVQQLESTILAQDKMYEAIRSMGEAAQATILSTTAMGINVNGENPLMKFKLEVHPTNRPAFTGETQGVIVASSLAKYQVGGSVWVKFNPNDTTQIALDHS